MSEFPPFDTDSVVRITDIITDHAPTAGNLAFALGEDVYCADNSSATVEVREDISTSASERRFSSEQEKLIHEYFPLAKSIAWLRARRHGSLNDYDQMLSDGYFGLFKGVLKYNPALVSGPKSVENYLSRYISGEITRGMRDRYGRYYPGDIDQEGETVKAERIGRTKPSVLYGTALSIDLPAEENGEGNSAPVSESLPAGPDYDIERLMNYLPFREALAQVVNKLPLDDREIFVRVVAQDQSRAQVAKDFGCSQMRISRLLKKIRERLEVETELEDLINS